MNEEIEYIDIIDGLLAQFQVQRDEILKMVGELEVIKGKIDQLIPNQLDKRYFRFFEEKVKAVTGFFNILLEMRKEITKTLKDEIELRRKVKIHEDDFDPEKDLDLHSIASKIERLNKKKVKAKEDIAKKMEHNIDPDEPLIKDLEIPGITAPLS